METVNVRVCYTPMDEIETTTRREEEEDEDEELDEEKVISDKLTQKR